MKLKDRLEILIKCPVHMISDSSGMVQGNSQELILALKRALSREEKLVDALKNIKGQEGMTNIGSCCVDKSCHPYYSDGEKLSHCAFGFGVNRGFNSCAAEAEQALADHAKELEK
jgi:hypothetical protein